MNEFDDNGWNEIMEAFSFEKCQIGSPNPDEIETNTVEDEIEFEEDVEAPDKHEINSTGLQKTFWDRRQLKLCHDIQHTDEYPNNDATHDDISVSTLLQCECQSEILHEDNCEDDTGNDDIETDDAEHKFIQNANEKIIEEGYGDGDKSVCIEPPFTRAANEEVIEELPPKDDDKNEIIGNKFTCDANNETIEECCEDENNNGFFGQEFTCDANYEIFEEFIEDGDKSDLVGHKFTCDACNETMDECCGDEDNNDILEQKFLCDAKYQTVKEFHKDGDKNDLVRIKFTFDANKETMEECCEEEHNNDFFGQKHMCDGSYEEVEEFPKDRDLFRHKYTCTANNKPMSECCEYVKVDELPDDGDKNDLVGHKLTCEANNGTMEQCREDEDSDYSAEQKFTYKANDDDKTDHMDYCSARQKFGGYGDYEIIENNAKHELKSPDELQVTDKNWDSPGDAETDMSCSENVPAESATALPAVQTDEKSQKNPQRNKSENKQRQIFHGVSFFTMTIIGFRKASSIKILFQTACFVSGLFSCISGINAERVSPQDTLAFLGATVRFRCSWDLKKPVYWEWTSVHSHTGYFLYIGNGGLVDKADDRITIDIDRERGRFDLVITGVLAKHAGTYNCIENSGLGKSASAELTVFDNLDCNMEIPLGGFMGENVFNIPEDIMLASCSVHFSGNKEPAIRWIPSKNVSHTNVTLTSKTESTITTSLIMRPTKELDKSVFVAYVDGSINFSITVGGQSWISDILTVNYVHLVNEPQEGKSKDDIHVLCNPRCSFAVNTVTYRYGDRNYELPLTFGDTASPKGDSKWQLILILSIVFFVASLSLLLSYAIYARFKIRKNNVYTKEENTRTSESEKQGSTESEEFIKSSA